MSWGKGKSSAILLNLMSYHIIKNKRYKIHQGSDPTNPWWSVYFHLLVQTFLQNRVVMMSCPWYAFVSPFLSDDFNLGTTEVGGCIFVGHFVGKICTHFATFGFLTPVKRGWLDPLYMVALFCLFIIHRSFMKVTSQAWKCRSAYLATADVLFPLALEHNGWKVHAISTFSCP